jgi:hypothetical protein
MVEVHLLDHFLPDFLFRHAAPQARGRGRNGEGEPLRPVHRLRLLTFDAELWAGVDALEAPGGSGSSSSQTMATPGLSSQGSGRAPVGQGLSPATGTHRYTPGILLSGPPMTPVSYNGFAITARTFQVRGSGLSPARPSYGFPRLDGPCGLPVS